MYSRLPGLSEAQPAATSVTASNRSMQNFAMIQLNPDCQDGKFDVK
jgi:hypothetical protein